MAKTIRHPELFQLPVAAEALFQREQERVNAARATPEAS
jgi:hypothetical protein